MIDKNGKCYACDNEAGVNVTGVEENCGVCTNRELWEISASNVQCVIPCPSDKPLRGNDGKCYSCDYENPVPLGVGADYCSSVCPNRIGSGWWNTHCSLPCEEDFFTASDGKCYSCYEEKSVDVNGVSHHGCEQCPNRILEGGRTCILECPSGQVKGGDGNCYSCDDRDPIRGVSESYCKEKCPNRIGNGSSNAFCSIPCEKGTFTGSDGNCYSCDEEKNISVLGVQHTGCEQCDNRLKIGNSCILECPIGQIKGDDGICYSCFHPDPIIIEDASDYCSNICPNRVANGKGNKTCSLACTGGTFTGADGKCYVCDEEKNISVENVTHDGCERCSDTRNLYNLMCVPKCSGDAPLRGSDNKCYPCDTETRVPVTNMTDACYECVDQRKLDGNSCVLK